MLPPSLRRGTGKHRNLVLFQSDSLDLYKPLSLSIQIAEIETGVEIAVLSAPADASWIRGQSDEFRLCQECFGDNGVGSLRVNVDPLAGLVHVDQGVASLALRIAGRGEDHITAGDEEFSEATRIGDMAELELMVHDDLAEEAVEPTDELAGNDVWVSQA